VDGFGAEGAGGSGGGRRAGRLRDGCAAARERRGCSGGCRAGRKRPCRVGERSPGACGVFGGRRDPGLGAGGRAGSGIRARCPGMGGWLLPSSPDGARIPGGRRTRRRRRFPARLRDWRRLRFRRRDSAWSTAPRRLPRRHRRRESVHRPPPRRPLPRSRRNRPIRSRILFPPK